MRILALTLLVLLAVFGRAQTAEAAVEARIDISTQRMVVLVDGVRQGEYAVSTGRKGYRTPTGDFKPQRMHKRYYSRKYHNSPMPHSIFFAGGIAVHGTYETGRLGRPASHGCVRLAPRAAAELFELVRQHGMQNSRIIVSE
ncbi:L,D-transpeptidase [Pinisolibacter aquiterrae]|uniref:L,D-transpeptidase n=1 Tax=Pinisolibacter aquiterrae TaxID=2815579 RepID=UPI001C3E19F3|nr:L,D-transpeptidase [Pinisolibacter aquiterrae]MBV5262969.1 L,D-transpeptidase [Pinisolibacter aquiterrae]MCC8235311.1 L,D-transpeptidase [Pinisolibacter aquiterrae]